MVLNNSLPDFSNKVKPGLDSRKLYKAMGYKIVEFKGFFGPAMGICIDHEKKLLLGAADPRSANGLAAGF